MNIKYYPLTLPAWEMMHSVRNCSILSFHHCLLKKYNPSINKHYLTVMYTPLLAYVCSMQCKWMLIRRLLILTLQKPKQMRSRLHSNAVHMAAINTYIIIKIHINKKLTICPRTDFNSCHHMPLDISVQSCVFK